MKVYELLQENSIPADWDKRIFNPKNVSFEKRLNYIKRRVNNVGEGSSRVAAEIYHEGRPTILKVAKSEQGIDQNALESKKLNDSNITKFAITIPMIDYDTEYATPMWIHVEKADPISNTKFAEYFDGYTPIHIIEIIRSMDGISSVSFSDEDIETFENVAKSNIYIQRLHGLMTSDPELKPDEWRTVSNWGLYQNRPVIIDLGGN